jgi:hypothetical protein
VKQIPEEFHKLPQSHWIPIILAELVEEVRQIRDILTPRLSATLTVTTKGEKSMPATILVGKTGQAAYQEWSGPNGTGDKLPSAGPVTFSSSSPTVATVDPNSGLVTAVAVGTATITGSDATNSLTASDTVTVTEVATSATLVVTAN